MSETETVSAENAVNDVPDVTEEKPTEEPAAIKGKPKVPQKRLSNLTREAENLLKGLGDKDVVEVPEGRRATRSSTRGGAVATPPPAKKERKSTSPSKKEKSSKKEKTEKNSGSAGKGRGRPKKVRVEETGEGNEEKAAGEDIEMTDDKEEKVDVAKDSGSVKENGHLSENENGVGVEEAAKDGQVKGEGEKLDKAKENGDDNAESAEKQEEKVEEKVDAKEKTQVPDAGEQDKDAKASDCSTGAVATESASGSN